MAIVGGIAAGMANGSPALLIAPILCGVPVWTFVIGLTIGRGSADYEIRPRPKTGRIVNAPSRSDRLVS